MHRIKVIQLIRMNLLEDTSNFILFIIKFIK